MGDPLDDFFGFDPYIRAPYWALFASEFIRHGPKHLKLMDLGQFAMMCVGTTRTRSRGRVAPRRVAVPRSFLIGHLTYYCGGTRLVSVKSLPSWSL